MKFGAQLKSSLIKSYYYYYLSYDDLKEVLKNGLKKNGNKWNEKLEEQFLGQLEAELDKVYTFQKVKSSEIERRLRDAERQVSSVVRSLDSSHPANEETFEELEDKVSEIIADVHDLAKYTRLNYTGFQKIVKKHDKQTGWILKPIFQVRLNAKPFFNQDYDALVVKLSQIYDLVRTRGKPVRGDAAAGGSQQNFVRQTTKYWVHPDNITDLKLYILKHLPVLVFNATKEFSKSDSAISSIYYDDSDLDLYKGRLQKTEGAEAIRLRWYGDMNSDVIFVERKTHREDWTGEKSVKARFTVKEKHVNDFLRGEYTVDDAFEKMKTEGKKSLAEIESLEELAQEVQYRVITKRLKPVMRTFYNRTAFQLPGDARVRISLDTELSMIREDDFDGKKRAGKNWRRMDIGIDYPFSQLPESDIYRFPYAVLEVKLQTQMGQEPPLWVRDLVSSHLVEAVPKFSKFITGVASLLEDKVDLIPYWLPQMNVDIRKPPTNLAVIRSQREEAGQQDDDDDDLDDDYEDEDEDDDDDRRVDAGPVPDEEQALLPHGNRAQQQQQQQPTNRRSRDIIKSLPRPIRKIYVRQLKPIIEEISEWYHYVFIVPSVDANPIKYTDVQIKAPPGKKICIPIRIEPKVYFANERTFLSWLEISIILSFIATGLLNFGKSKDDLSTKSGIGFLISAVITMSYSICNYLRRVYQIRHRLTVRYDDMIGPSLICFLFVLATAANYYLLL